MDAKLPLHQLKKLDRTMPPKMITEHESETGTKMRGGILGRSLGLRGVAEDGAELLRTDGLVGRFRDPSGRGVAGLAPGSMEPRAGLACALGEGSKAPAFDGEPVPVGLGGRWLRLRCMPALLLALVAFVGLGACGGEEPEANDAPGWSSPDGDLGGPDYDPEADNGSDPQAIQGATTEIDAPTLPAPRVLFLGDSLSAGLHLPADEAFPAVLEQRLAAAGQPFELLNAGVSGDTTAGGLARLDWLLRQNPDLVVVELGANDGLRGVSLDSVESNLRKIITRLQERDLPVLLLGMKLPPNYGATYAGGFEELYERVAADMGVHFVPFFLEGVAGDPKLNLPDGIHPTTEGHERIADNLEAIMKDLVGDLRN